MVSNNLPFHGIVFRYMKENPGQSASMENIVRYLKENQIDSEEKILRVGRETLDGLKNDDEMFEIYEEITKEKFVRLSDLFDFGRTQRLKSREIKKEMTKDILS